MRTDLGTENSNLAFIQPYLRRNHLDCFSGSDSFRYGKSVSNQVSFSSIFIVYLKECVNSISELKHGGLLLRNGAPNGGITSFL